MVPSFGKSSQSNPLNIFLKDNLAGMGDYLTQEVGSLAWIEARTYAQAQTTAFSFLQLLANQLQPGTSSIYLDQWAQVYNLQGLSLTQAIKEQIEVIQALTGTPPTLSNVIEYLQYILGNVFLSVQWTPENQYFATIDPYQDLIVDGYLYEMPLATLIVYVWQPRDNQDNLLMPTNVFNQLVDTYKPILQSWAPHFTEIITMNLINRGNLDGYNGGNYNNYADGYNVVSGVTGSTTLTGVNTSFIVDFTLLPANNELPFCIARTPPIQIVDDTNVVQTYYVKSVANNTTLTLTSPIINTITSRTYRILGIAFDTSGMLDQGSLFSF